MRYLRAFGSFWYDFLVGDRPELFVGPILALVLAWLAVVVRVPAAGAGILLFVCVLAVGGLSLYLTARPHS